jgi:hypothetical protein
MTKADEADGVSRVQWAQGSAGVRSSRYHGIGKIHVVDAEYPWKTRCGRSLPRRSMRWESDFSRPDGTYPPHDEDYCRICREKEPLR